MAEILANRFVILEGEKARPGGLSVVRKAIDSRTGEAVAVKFISGRKDAINRKLFEREVEALQALSHPNIVRLISSGEDETGTHYLVLEWHEDNLKEALNARGAIGWEEALEELVLPLVEGLAHAHLRNVQHRDIKPGNVLLSGRGAPILADFGIGKQDFSENTDLTVQAFRSGIYAPPELEATMPFVRDVYSVGVLLLQAMTQNTLTDYHQLEPAISALNLPQGLRKLLEKCTNRNPTERPANASVLLEGLRDVMRERQNGANSPKGVLWLRLTRAATDQLLDGEPEGTSAERKIVDDLLNGPCVEYRFDAERAAHDRSVIYLTGDAFKYRLAVNTGTPELTVTAAYAEEFEVLERSRRRGLPIGNWATWASTRPMRLQVAQDGMDLLLGSLDDFYAARSAKGAVEAGPEDGDELLDAWLRMLQAREELARGDKSPILYEGRSSRRRELTVTLTGGLEGELLGSEWEVRSSSESRRAIARGEVIGQKGQDLTLLLRGRPVAVPQRGALVPYLGPSQVSLQRQGDAVLAVKSGLGGMPDLKALLANPAQAHAPNPVLVETWTQDLDEDKKRAVSSALGSEEIHIVKGPPGTGKTAFITELVAQFLRANPGRRVLIVSQTHVAVDNALIRLAASSSDGLVRLGAVDDPRINESVRPLLLDQQMDRWAISVRRAAETHIQKQAAGLGLSPEHLQACLTLQELAAVRREEERVHDFIQRSHQDGHDSSLATSLEVKPDLIELEGRIDRLREQGKDLLGAAQAQLGGALTLRTDMDAEDVRAAVDVVIGADDRNRALLTLLGLQGEWLQRVVSDRNLAAAFLQTSRVIAGTCLGFLRHPAVRDLEIDLCIVDEASKATATEALVPISRAKRTILVGDSNQLPPSDEDLLRRKDLMQEHDLSPEQVQETLFQRLTDSLPPSCIDVLRDQYRMIRPIGELISTCFYNGELRSPRTEGLKGYQLLGKPVHWIDTATLGERRREESSGAGPSKANRTEANIVMDRLHALRRGVEKGYIEKPPGRSVIEVLLIAPYRAQVEELRRRLATFRSEHLDVQVESVDAVQGREADIAILSVTRSNPRAELGFLGPEYWRRINVALSRARYGLTIVGDAEFCGSTAGALRDVLLYMRRNPEDCEIQGAIERG